MTIGQCLAISHSSLETDDGGSRMNSDVGTHLVWLFLQSHWMHHHLAQEQPKV